MDSKKISFGFSKLSKKPNVIASKPQQQKNDIELIDCVEEQNIKVKNPKDETKGPLIIPMNESSNRIIDRIKESRTKRNEIKEEVDERPDSELTLDELAARELMREVKNAKAEATTVKVLEVPKSEDTVVLEGKEEPTIDDYENVPISDYGMAMLRGMGWKEGMVIGKNQNSKIDVKEPTLRPKGLGLGANKMANVEKQSSKNDEELLFKKGAYAKITAGRHKGLYCQIEGFDDEAGRVVVKLALKGLTLSLNEFLLSLVSKQEYEKSSKVINNAKYEEFIKSETGSSRSRRGNEQNPLDVDRRIKKEIEDDESSKQRSRSPSIERNHRKYKKSSKKHKKRSNSSHDEDADDVERKSHRNKRDRSRSRERSRKHKTKHKR